MHRQDGGGSYKRKERRREEREERRREEREEREERRREGRRREGKMYKCVTIVVQHTPTSPPCLEH